MLLSAGRQGCGEVCHTPTQLCFEGSCNKGGESRQRRSRRKFKKNEPREESIAPTCPKLVSGTMWHFHCCRNSHFKKYFRILKSLTMCHRALIAVIRPNEDESP